MKLFDSHLHLTDTAFAEDRDAVLERARAAGVAGLVTVASNIDDARAAGQLARELPGVRATAGVHPHEARDWDPGRVGELLSLLERPEFVAVGETGLDFFYDNSPRREQGESFEAHLELAAETGLPVIVHSREADAETTALIRRFSGRARGVLHCFAGGPSLLTAGLDAGWHVSFSGLVTFKRYDGAELVRRVPGERLLIETDSPYLSPVPRRGRRNEPAMVAHVCRAVAELRREAVEDVARVTYTNACSVYGIEDDA